MYLIISPKAMFEVNSRPENTFVERLGIKWQCKWLFEWETTISTILDIAGH